MQERVGDTTRVVTVDPNRVRTVLVSDNCKGLEKHMLKLSPAAVVVGVVVLVVEGKRVMARGGQRPLVITCATR